MLEQREAGEMRIRLAADAASVPGARRFVTDGLTSLGRTELLDDAALCVTELAANAALHSSSTFMEVALRAIDQSVQIVVEDDGPVPAEVVVPRASFDEPGEPDKPESDDELDLDELDLALADESTTGRGLGIVSVLAQDWGVEETGDGKRVWLTLAEGDGTHAVRPPTVSTASAGRAEDAALPEGWAVVRLAGCPVHLSLRQDSHLDELVRELQLLDAEQAPRSRGSWRTGSRRSWRRRPTRGSPAVASPSRPRPRAGRTSTSTWPCRASSRPMCAPCRRRSARPTGSARSSGCSLLLPTWTSTTCARG